MVPSFTGFPIFRFSPVTLTQNSPLFLKVWINISLNFFYVLKPIREQVGVQKIFVNIKLLL